MPNSLVLNIKKTSNKEVVWVSCEGENPADVENLGTDIKFKSLTNEQGFIGKYFPFKNTKGYLQPLVAVQFNSIKSKHFFFESFQLFKRSTRFSAGVLINIECKAWAKNIKHDRHDRRGSVHFELMIDEAPKKKN